jgi:hypothetical protein
MTPDECQYVLDIDAVLSEALSDHNSDSDASLLLLQQSGSSDSSEQQYATAHTSSSDSGGLLGGLKLEYQSASMALQVASTMHSYIIIQGRASRLHTCLCQCCVC